MSFDDEYPFMDLEATLDRAAGWRSAESFNGDQEVGIVLAAEVLRLRSELELYKRAEPLVVALLKAVLDGLGSSQAAFGAFKRIDAASIALRRYLIEHEDVMEHDVKRTDSSAQPKG